MSDCYKTQFDCGRGKKPVIGEQHSKMLYIYCVVDSMGRRFFQTEDDI